MSITLQLTTVPSGLCPEDILAYQQRGWTWAYCISDTWGYAQSYAPPCTHRHHDPPTSGPTLVLRGEEESINDQNQLVILLNSGMKVYYTYTWRGWHRCPVRTLGLRATP